MKIRNKINLSFISIFALTLFAVSAVFWLYSSNLIKTDIHSYLTSSNRARAEHVRTFIQEKENTALILAASSVYRNLLKEPVGSSQYYTIKDSVNKRLTRNIEADSNIHQNFILDKTGKIIASSNKAEDGADKSKDDYFINGKERSYFKGVYFSDVINGYAYAVSAPILDDDGSFLGISVLRFSADDFYSIVGNENGLGSQEENFLIDRNKFFITPSRFFGEEVILKQKVETQTAQNCFDSKEIEYVSKNGYSGLLDVENHAHVIENKDYRNIDVTATHSYIPETGWCLITKVDTAQLLSYQTWLFLIIFFIFVVSLVVFILLSYLLSGRITNSLSYLSKAAESVKNGNFNFKSNLKSHDEIGSLSDSFNLMIEAIKKSRAEVDKKVKDQTQEIITKQSEMESQQKAILNILSDVEEEKDKTVLLAKDLEKFKMAVDNASDHIVITDADGTIIYANRGVENITGFKMTEVLGKKSGGRDTWGGLMEKDFYAKMWDTIKNKKKVFSGELKNRRKNGEEYEVIANISPVLDAGGQVVFFVGIERDITKEKQIDKAKTEFVSLASHQLRTPLSAINWYTEMLLNGDAGKINDEQKQYLDEVYKGNQRMVELVNSLLNVSRLELGTFIIEPELIDLTQLADEVLKELLPQTTTKKLKVKANYDKKLEKYSADPKLMKIVFQNLLSNAVKYTPDGGNVDLSIGKDTKSILITVKDSGYGITKSQQDKIFTKLFRADNVREKDTEGTGLGLYLVKSIVDSAAGKVWFESAENKGSTFYVSLPLSGMKKKEGTKELS